MCNACHVVCLPHEYPTQQRREEASPRFARLRHSRYDTRKDKASAPGEQEAGGCAPRWQAVAKGRQGRGFGRFAIEPALGRALRCSRCRAHLPTLAHPRSQLGFKEPSAAPPGRNRAHFSLRPHARFARFGKRALQLVPLAALPICGHNGSLPSAPAMPWAGSSLPPFRLAPCLLLWVYICKRFTFIYVNVTFVNRSRL